MSDSKRVAAIEAEFTDRRERLGYSAAVRELAEALERAEASYDELRKAIALLVRHHGHPPLPQPENFHVALLNDLVAAQKREGERL